MPSSTEQVITYSFAKDHGVLVLPKVADTDLSPTLGVREGARAKAVVEARRAVGKISGLKPLSQSEFDAMLSNVYASRGIQEDYDESGLDDQADLSSLVEGIPKTADLLDADDDAPIIKLINGLIFEAVKRRASDVHIEPYEDKLSIRYRIDGVLQDVLSPSRRLAPLLVSRIKVMARLDIAEKRMPQDGRISLALGGRSIDVRVSTLPSRYGERVVLRLLDKDQARLSLRDLGMSEAELETFRTLLSSPNGIVLVTGPTGSGKTTTLYSGLSMLNNQTRNILTVEDPIEYGLDGVGQTQVNAKVGLTFAAGLRAILRQDPDVVMVGEIRDLETAEIAVQSSLTGHLVLSTVHTNSAIAAVTRLRDMGIEPFLLSSTLRGVLAQRLVRRLCLSCREAYQPADYEMEALGLTPQAGMTFYREKGCMACSNTGFDGRAGVFEIVSIDQTLRRLIHDEASEHEMEAHAFRQGESLFQNGVRHVLDGVTTAAEVLRVCRPDGEGNANI
ncbi:MAG: type II secretion system protein GspE [Ponticaulis sp.]|nr:type II secretion system protein GspE [Ponticaulis sp.]|tara:strand:+ start:51093 stop:52604 length:1512 start_codon:yes stop_codon:yes gene_type:complete